MKKYLFLIGLLFSTSCYSADRVTLQSGTGEELGTQANPLKVSDTTGFLALTDPNADRIAFWDDSAGAVQWLQPDGVTITISGTTLSATASAAGWTDGGTDVTLTTSTDNVGIGGASLGKFSVDGDTDEIQGLFQGHATQTNPIVTIEKSDGTDLFTFSNTGVLTTSGSGTEGVTVGAGSNATVTALTMNVSGTDTTLTGGSAMDTFSHDITVSGSDIILGGASTGVKFTDDGDGQLTIASVSSGSAENLTINLDDTANTAVIASGTGVTNITTTGIALTVGGTGAQSTITEGLIVNNGSGTDEDDDFTVNVSGGAYEIDAGSGTFTSTANDAGWAVVDQTDNQACTTGCTSACVMGWNGTTPVSCNSALADICLCMGSS